MANNFSGFGNDYYTHVCVNHRCGVFRPEVVRFTLTLHHFSRKVVETSGCSELYPDSFSFVDVVDKPETQPVSGFFSFGV